MRLTDEQIIKMYVDAMLAHPMNVDRAGAVVGVVRRCLALAALPDEQKEYNDRERRGWEVSQPGGLPK